MGESYLIPANSKKSMLILGFFNPTDLIIFGTGCIITFILLMTVESNNLKQAAFIIAPAIICSFLVLPVPNHHNIRTFIGNVYNYFTNRRSYFWRGWCINSGEK